MSAINNTRYFYNFAHAIAYKVGDALLISIEVPIFPPENVLNVYKINAINTPFHTSNGNHPNKSSILLHNHEYVAFSRDTPGAHGPWLASNFQFNSGRNTATTAAIPKAQRHNCCLGTSPEIIS
jgi:hypothetical protein